MPVHVEFGCSSNFDRETASADNAVGEIKPRVQPEFRELRGFRPWRNCVGESDAFQIAMRSRTGRFLPDGIQASHEMLNVEPGASHGTILDSIEFTLPLSNRRCNR